MEQDLGFDPRKFYRACDLYDDSKFLCLRLNQLMAYSNARNEISIELLKERALAVVGSFRREFDERQPRRHLEIALPQLEYELDMIWSLVYRFNLQMCPHRLLTRKPSPLEKFYHSFF